MSSAVISGYQALNFSSFSRSRLLSSASRRACCNDISRAARSLDGSASCRVTNLKGCLSQVMGLNICAEANTVPVRARNINFTTEPCCNDGDNESNPPVTEMTCNSPEKRRPSGNRSTTGEFSAKRTRSVRRLGCSCGRYGITAGVSMPPAATDWQITEGQVTALPDSTTVAEYLKRPAHSPTSMARQIRTAWE